MSRSCHSATFSRPACALPRSTRARPVMRSLVIGLRLCGIALDPFWPSAKRLLHLAHLRALQVADLRREPLQRGAGERDRAQHLGVAVTRDDLGRDVLRPQAEALQRGPLDLRARAPSTCRRRRRACPPPRPRTRARRRSAARRLSNAKPASLSPKVVGSACTPWVRPMHSTSRELARAVREHRGQRVGARRQLAPGLAQLKRERRVEHVGGREPEVDPAPGLAHRLRDDVDERRHVVVGRALALPDGIRIGRPRLP